jgi:hypothetical protein
MGENLQEDLLHLLITIRQVDDFNHSQGPFAVKAVAGLIEDDYGDDGTASVVLGTACMHTDRD